MKKLLILAALLMLASAAYADGHGSGFGALATADGMGAGTGSFMVFAGVADATSFGGSFNYGFSKYFDGRLKLAIIDPDYADSKVTFGADFKYNFLSMDSVQNAPFDMALGGFLEYYDYDGFNVLIIGGQYIGSYPILLKNNTTLTPYGRFNARLEKASYDNPVINDDSKLEFGLNGGVKWQMTQTIDLFGEFQIDGNDGLFFGLNFKVM